MNDLDSLEKKIDLTVLKWYNREDYRAKQERFRQTVMAAHTIVSQKLYKTKSQTVESYFRDVWKISRASVYRFLDCALVLEQLKDFPDWSKPSHERLCRSLKKLTKNPVHMRYLWKKVLLKAGDNPNLITSTFIKKVWQELITSGEMPNVDENDENNLFKKKKGTSKNSKLESSNSNSKLKKKINNDQSLLQYNGNNNSYNNDNNNMKSNQDVSNQCDSNNNSQYNLSLSSSLSSSQTFKIESTDHSPSFSELNIQQNMNNTISVPSNDNWIHDSSQSIINPNLSCSSNSSSSCSSTYGMNDNEQNHKTMNENSSSKEIKPAWSLSMEIFNNSNYNNNNNKNSNSNKNNTDDFNQNHIESKNISSSILNIENLL
ncbi:hypothetical protein H8356DRAFT_1294585 [Neocallimastix lanati (nom. inval.)]|uniref:Uncharacterized protein n=1 Tax=Neocallimastix californiae TaxID=1754190 RepID=A0A1Y1YZ68_9FUNG|nr:hypothetical protein H8356DRAFT_1294585 [Neocallimastix sp. JGI-2020a]ORY02865.1 hypothetical protein LY90DRAFT_678603 [Neocallimastix californiae]|eukprot:ORY02865.1 hypothetical protein LY90DRAFT_678603 [Neocallimastix californiae]